MAKTLSLNVPSQPPWVELWNNTADFWTRLFGVNLEKRQQQKLAEAQAELERQAAIQDACNDVARKLALQVKVAGCDLKRRSERWNNAQFMRWQQYHAAAFELVYGKLSGAITVKQAEVFSRNFHYVEYLLAKRHHILMEEWGRKHREKLCELLRSNDQLFSGVRRFHRMKRLQHHKLMDQIDSAFSAS